VNVLFTHTVYIVRAIQFDPEPDMMNEDPDVMARKEQSRIQ